MSESIGLAVRFAELRYPEVEVLLASPAAKLALLPVGSTEADGCEECTRWPDGRRMQ